jgi:hypothetical protein
VSTLLFIYIIYFTFVSNTRIGYNPWRSVTNFEFNK